MSRGYTKRPYDDRTGMLSCEHTQGAIDGKKRIILNPTSEQRSSHEKASFVAGEVYGVDVLVTSNPDGKVSDLDDFPPGDGTDSTPA